MVAIHLLKLNFNLVLVEGWKEEDFGGFGGNLQEEIAWCSLVCPRAILSGAKEALPKCMWLMAKALFIISTFSVYRFSFIPIDIKGGEKTEVCVENALLIDPIEWDIIPSENSNLVCWIICKSKKRNNN